MLFAGTTVNCKMDKYLSISVCTISFVVKYTVVELGKNECMFVKIPFKSLFYSLHVLICLYHVIYVPGYLYIYIMGFKFK